VDPPEINRAAASIKLREIPTWITDAAQQRSRSPRPADRLGAKIAATSVPDPAGAETPVLDWRERLVCSRCGSQQADMVVSGTMRRPRFANAPS
jgi:hypothetical protein